ncbi:histidinol-phosphate transaminase [Candidatus Bathyarchaeota archaeon]|nr:histidinol-phosphate transaminase [Candidatus Bathyarchaeota archaeon]
MTVHSQTLKDILTLIGTYDPGLFPEDVTRIYGIPEKDIVNLGSNENPYMLPEDIIEKIAGELHKVNRYPNPSYMDLKEAISDYIGLPPNHITVGNGSSDLIDMICKATLNPLDKIVIPLPTYTLYMLTSMFWEAEIKYLETEGEGFDVRASSLEPHMKNAKLVFLGSPNNPTGRSIDRKELEEMLKFESPLIIVDEAYAEFSGKTAIELVKNSENLIVLRSMSKYFCLAGLRIGYAVSNPKIIEGLEKVRLPFNVNRLAQTAAVQALKSLKHFRAIGEEINREREDLSRELKTIGFEPIPSDSNFLMVKLPEGQDSEIFTHRLASKGVIIRSLKNLPGLTSGEYVRVTVGRRGENKKFLEVCREILSE